jgi:hypothetical protein
MVPATSPCSGRYQMPGTPATCLRGLVTSSERTTGGEDHPAQVVQHHLHRAELVDGEGRDDTP